MNAVGTQQHLHIPVLRKKRDRRHGFASEHVFKVFRHRKAGVFDFGNSIVIALLRLADKLLYSGFHGPEHWRCRWQTDHFESAHRLVKLLAGDSQGAYINRRQIGTPGRLGIPNKSFKRFGRAFKGLAKLIEHPGQRAQVINGEIGLGCRSVGDLGLHK